MLVLEALKSVVYWLQRLLKLFETRLRMDKMCWSWTRKRLLLLV